LFSDSGVSFGRVSTLFIIWSLTSFVCEIPSGAWADSFDRRHLLVLSAVIYGGGFSAWILMPTYAGFAFGFVLWGLSSAIMSGTFESLLYDELLVRKTVTAYPWLIGWAHSTAMIANVSASLLAAPLFALGGYGLVGWTSVGIAGLQALLATTLPVSPAARRPSSVTDQSVHDVVEETEAWAGRYVAMLRAGVHQAATLVEVRRVVLIASVLIGLMAYDEYFPLIARDHGVATSTVPYLVGLAVVGQLVGTALAGWTARMSARTMAVAVMLGGGLISLGSLVSPYAGFAAIAVGYGLLNNSIIVAGARLQEVITGPARATVTSVHGFATEVFAVAVYTVFAAGTRWVSVPVLVAALGVPILVIAECVRRWFPDTGVHIPDELEVAD
jgi:hypothetical protein